MIKTRCIVCSCRKLVLAENYLEKLPFATICGPGSPTEKEVRIMTLDVHSHKETMGPKETLDSHVLTTHSMKRAATTKMLFLYLCSGMENWLAGSGSGQNLGSVPSMCWPAQLK